MLFCTCFQLFFASGIATLSLPVPVHRRAWKGLEGLEASGCRSQRHFDAVKASPSLIPSGEPAFASISLVSVSGFQSASVLGNAMNKHAFSSLVSSFVRRSLWLVGSVCPQGWMQKRADHLDRVTHPSQNSRQSLGWETASVALGTFPLCCFSTRLTSPVCTSLFLYTP